jgi:hypothetical protein
VRGHDGNVSTLALGALRLGHITMMPPNAIMMPPNQTHHGGLN